jgi:N-acetyl-anhydromuramyl-L-alanine amidase AmpD
MMTAEYPGAKWVPAATSSYRHGCDRKISRIIMHITDGRSIAENTAAMFGTPGCRTSAHFVIGQDGQVVQCVAIDNIAYHAHKQNAISVGVEHCARSPHEFSPQDPGLPLSEYQIMASVALTRWLCTRFALPMDRGHVLGHAEADPDTDHSDCCEGVAGGWPWYRWCVDGVARVTV